MADNAGYTETNRKHWDEQAASYNSRFQSTQEQLIKEIRARKDWIGVEFLSDDSDDEEEDEEHGSAEGGVKGVKKGKEKIVRMLDYACGTGLMSRALAPYVTQAVGIDLSPNMVEAYNTVASNQGLSSSEMHAVEGDLISTSTPSPSLNNPEFFEFDLAAVNLGFHHFEDPGLAAKRLTERLKPGGTLLILDFCPHDPWKGDDKAIKTIAHHGFSEERIKEIFEKAGAGKDFSFEVMRKAISFVKAGDGHAHGHGHGHGHADDHDHGHSHGEEKKLENEESVQKNGEEHGHGHTKTKDGRVMMTRYVFMARGTKA